MAKLKKEVKISKAVPAAANERKALLGTLPLDGAINRNKQMSVSRKIWFDIGRLAEPALQYMILGYGYGYVFWKVVGLPVKHMGVTGILSPRMKVMMGMSTVAALRQAYWVTCVNRTDFHPAAIVGVNVVVSSVNSLLLLRNPTWELSYLDYLGIGLFALGSCLETVSDIQRKNFIEDKKNAGRIQTNGLFSLARHINYGGFVLWRLGHALATGSAWALFAPLANLYDFLARAIPAMDKRMVQKNKPQWEQYKKSTPHKLIPYII
ncbi:hypothetical protein SeMB42_g00772 [Synchytrium endobioticum]|uniref:Uncharacterized protein n=1 Tax=Synchytrium endobioticum TaxID=286115 RepID=A0A507CQP1_9FUNG|nr:hypothetical protein SeLEV6574_g06081 [Synchytrium endobioticum]TPX53482.1 hypothetical protein SeMB42_g00772 [Synchytrium endobioticum]